MNSICILGNSHVAGIYKAMHQSAITNIDVYAGRGKLLNDVTQDKQSLIFKNPKFEFHSNYNNNRLRLTQYEHIVIYGCQVISRGLGTDWLINYYDSISGRYSDSCIQALFLESLSTSLAVKLIKLIQSSGYTGKITVLPSPLPNENHDKVIQAAHQETPDVLRKVCELYKLTLQDINVEFRALPEALLANNSFSTCEKYQNGRSDLVHLNIDGCTIVLNDILDELL